MTTTKMENYRGAYMAIDRAIYDVTGRCCADDQVCYEPDDPEYCVDICWFCWRETGTDGECRDTLAKVSVLLDSNHRHALGVATVSFSAGKMIWGDTPHGLIRGGERLAVTSAWIEAGGLRVYSGRVSEEGCAVAEVSDDVAFRLLENIARGCLPAVSLQFAGESRATVFQFMKPIDCARGSLIEAQISIVKQSLAAGAGREP